MKIKNLIIVSVLISSIFLSIGCLEDAGTGVTQMQEAQLTESNQQRLMNSCPAPEISNSLERENLKRRIEFLNDANKDLYVALLSNDGKVLATYVTNGKVSSLNSYLTTNDQIVDDPHKVQDYITSHL